MINLDTIIEDIDRIISDLIVLREHLEEMKKPPKITEDQKRYIQILYKRLGEDIPENLDKMSKREASKLFNQLKTELKGR